MLRKIVIGILVVIILAVVVGLFLPSKVHVERSTVIAAASAAIHPHIANFKDGWSKWSPWNAAADPSLKYTYDGAESGVGAIQSWTSDQGNGRMEITASDPAKGVDYEISFQGSEPHPLSISFQSEGDGTRVVWTFDYDVGWHIGYRYMMLYLRGEMDDYYDRGLASLKKLVEEGAAAETGE